ncbi:metalloregulator ArsR/SmtB family transcription factor [Micromonospora sp. NPDC006766]|uniref:ArsR/SmtB family transcription factor n=1 Tax=Micromonospora sp. NPDC006766 TaxID=3154778 RepID=UPI0033FFC53B
MTDASEIDAAVDVLRLIAHPVRIRILLVLTETDACVTDLSARLNRPVSYLSHQLRHLRHARLVRRYRDGNRMNYALATTPAAGLILEALRHLLRPDRM